MMHVPFLSINKLQLRCLIPADMDETHLFLDLDGTLIGGDVIPIPRPHLDGFLSFCFDNFDHVYIWTAAMPIWVMRCRSIFSSFKFDMTFYRTSCEIRGDLLVKPFEKIWQRYPTMNPKKCILIDDNPDCFCNNPENAMLVPTFMGSDDDIELLILIDKLKYHIGKKNY